MLLFTVAAALAGPLVPVQGALSDAAGPVQGSRPITFALYDAETGGSPSHTETQTVAFEGGVFAAVLGHAAPFSDTFFRDHPASWIEVTLDGAPSARVPVGVAPYAAYAAHAGDAGTVGGASLSELWVKSEAIPWSALLGSSIPAAVRDGYVAGTGLSLSGTTLAVNQGALQPSWSNVQGIPSGFSDGTDDGNTYTAGAGLTLTGSSFAVNQGALQPSWGNVQGIPSGFSDGTDDGNTYSAGVGLALSGSQFSVSYTALDARYAPVGGSGTATAIALPSDTANQPCPTGTNAAAVGTIRFRNGSFEGCTVGGWRAFLASIDGLASTSAAPSCKYIRDNFPSAGSADYWIDPDGAAGVAPFQASCDMTTDSGGWTLILNYLHLAGTNPANTVRNSDLPRKGSDTLGTNEDGTAFWGHAGNTMTNRFTFTAAMFYCKSSLHSRVIHFKTTGPNTLSYIKTGTGTMTDVWSASFSTNLPLRVNSTLPLHTNGENSATTNQGDAVLTYFPFYSDSSIGNPRAHWAVKGDGARWECDDFPASQGSSGTATHTLHRVWIR
jgi:hypothetical protein